MAFRTANSEKLAEQRRRQRERAKRAALRALDRARKAVAETGTELSAWEDDFLGSVGDRVETYGRAFRDFQKGSPSASLSNRQCVKLKEIAGKAAGKPTQRSGTRRSVPR